MNKADTIAAISTPLGEGGIGIVRLSGPDAYRITLELFECIRSTEMSFPEPRRLYHGYIRNQEGLRIDEVLTAFMPAPHTYTREDVVEINCHSGIMTLRIILKLVLESGARLAEPGEYTKRAFINGRIDLSQAEAVMNIVRARSEEAVQVASRALQGELTDKIEQIRDDLLAARAPLEAWFDYPDEHEEGAPGKDQIKAELEQLQKKVSEILQGVERNRAYQEGVSVAIIGKPNVGKSSLLNALLRQQRAIVHELPGTTRDMLEGFMSLGGYPIRLVDTAGIQGTDDPVEKEGIERSRLAANQARMLIMVIDGSTPLDEADNEITMLRKQNQGLVIVVNKKDLEKRVPLEDLEKIHEDAEIIETAAIKGEGISLLEDAVTRQLDTLLGSNSESPAIVSLRHEEILTETLKYIDSAMLALETHPLELVSLELQNAWNKLGEITGETVSEALLDKIFSEFCLGK